MFLIHTIAWMSLSFKVGHRVVGIHFIKHATNLVYFVNLILLHRANLMQQTGYPCYNIYNSQTNQVTILTFGFALTGHCSFQMWEVLVEYHQHLPHVIL